ncbi:DUF2380 domain-containing protein [Aurantimonas sp. VKM B-3413]|uniref:DUF2380 domain-containing protein n=1 Tax=Aurantimonas sp. VKM B-3413 TaxID=2779401 RepID=UPI001E3F1F20|nr:DUF2380 domain-containing protein [Aurantimonas sp. VKM B-3413]MCB8838016.1 DUF3280 domain-containing protein [Aurantimonas sp. VKM B-3413]
MRRRRQNLAIIGLGAGGPIVGRQSMNAEIALTPTGGAPTARPLLVAAAGLFMTAVPVAAEPPATVAVIAFDYVDTSGEARDQTKEHADRLAAFRTRLRDRLVEGPDFRPVELSCLDRSGCSAETTPPAELLKEARSAGADFLVFGGIHKMSTLVGWGRVDVLDVAADKLVSDRIISFRGDTDEAFDRAAEFAAKDILTTLGGSRAADASERRKP